MRRHHFVRARAYPPCVDTIAKRILVVEDEPTMADVVSRYLRRDGHEVRTVADGHAALTAFRDFQPDLLVLDLMLPGIDGLEVCRQVRAAGPTPVIMLTARGGRSVDRLVGFGVGADDYVTKPFSPRELAARVRRSCGALRRSRSRILRAPRSPSVRSRSTGHARGDAGGTSRAADSARV